MVSRETQHHTTLNFYKLDIKKPQLCGFCHIILFTSVKNPAPGVCAVLLCIHRIRTHIIIEKIQDVMIVKGFTEKMNGTV